MNPLVCYGVMGPTDSRGQCSLRGLYVFKQEGNTCYYCQPINPPIEGFIVSMDDLAAADAQGFRCGVDQEDPDCYAICSGNGSFKPPAGTENGSGPGPGPTTGGPSAPGPPSGPQEMSGPKPGPLQGYVTNAPDPCLPFGPGGYDYCANPANTRPAGCICPEMISKPPQQGTTSSNKPPPSNPVVDTAQYLQGMVAGFGSCFKGVGDLIAGAGFFAQGDFVNAAKAWGLSPGQSVTLKAMYAELTAPVIGQNSSPYESGMTAGRRLCQYAAIPGAAKAAGTVLKGAVSPGSTFTNPIKGGALQDAVNSAPQSLANKWVQTAKGPAQLGSYAGQGSFASVFKYGKGSVMKLSRNNPETMGYGPDSIAGQNTGAARLKGIGVDTPDVSNYEPGSSGQPATLVADDVTQKYPGSFQLSSSKFAGMAAAQQGQVLNAIQNLSNKIANAGYGWLDTNPGNITLQPIADGFNAIIHDPDMIMNLGEIENLAADDVPRGVMDYGLRMAGQGELTNQPFTIQSLMNALENGRLEQLRGAQLPSQPPVMNVPSGTVPGR
jgi:hypothetical protein